jgi:hypothetical protein
MVGKRMIGGWLVKNSCMLGGHRPFRKGAREATDGFEHDRQYRI